jgi:hypothetical protein
VKYSYKVIALNQFYCHILGIPVADYHPMDKQHLINMKSNLYGESPTLFLRQPKFDELTLYISTLHRPYGSQLYNH